MAASFPNSYDSGALNAAEAAGEEGKHSSASSTALSLAGHPLGPIRRKTTWIGLVSVSPA
jgi:hypothetical protein